MARYGYAFFDSGVRFDSPDANPSVAMRKLSRYLENPFDSRAISLAEQVAFSTDHLGRMSANNPNGELTARIAATTSALTLVEDCFSDDLTRLGIRAARVLAKDNFRKTLPDEVAKIEAAVVARYGPNAPELLECCPQGRSIFSQCRDDAVQNHLQTLVNGVTAHAADLGQPLVTQATNLKAAWMTIYEASEAATTGRTATKEGKNLARENLSLMLFLNLLKLAEMFPRQPEKLALYMRQDLLGPIGGNEEEEEEEPGGNGTGNGTGNVTG
jgi:hypothetical protein